MKNNTGTILGSIGGLFSIFGMTILSDFYTIKYIALGLGVILAIVGVYLEQKEKQSQS